MTPKQLQKSFVRWSGQGKALVLASVYETEGSTYSQGWCANVDHRRR